MSEEDCICLGNWRRLVKETENLLECKYRGNDGEIYNFFGLVWGKDDLYYGMYRKGQLVLLSCVLAIESHGYKLIKQPTKPKRGIK